MADEPVQPIIIKRIKKGGHGHHGGAWKVAFADFMTAMMAFFMVMWLVGQSSDVRESVAGHFRNPGEFDIKGKSGILKGSDGIIPSNDPSISSRKANLENEPKSPSNIEKEKMTRTAKNIVQELKKQEAFQRLKDNIKVQMTSEGLRVILNESRNAPAFFEPGSAKLLQKSAVILMTIAKELGTLQNRLVIEGHTDASFTGDIDYTNWELSTDRANSTRQLMEVSGLYKEQVQEVVGFANQFPMIVDSPNDARNRRITIVVLYQNRSNYYDHIEVGSDLLHEAESG
ncbi:MAG: flagellar motor protein MotB [candidate division Zixibacteria bacterium]|nr:flagellar motor protein MotB [candidate division Zixibacteria bacterium]